DLAGNGAIRLQEDVLCELLGDGGAALHIGAGLEIDDHGAGEADGVDTDMPVEALVLRCEDGLDDMGREIGDGSIAAHQIAAMAEHLAIGGNAGERGRVLDVVEAGGVRQVEPVPEEQSAKGDEAPEAEKGAA